MNKKAETKTNWILIVLAILAVLYVVSQQTTLFSAVNPSVTNKNCVDPDGNDIYTKSAVYIDSTGETYEDECYQGRVYETQCAEDGNPIALLYYCPRTTHCVDGACRGVEE